MGESRKFKPYREWIWSTQPALCLFLIDQSDSLIGKDAEGQKSAASLIAEAVNGWLTNIDIRCSTDRGVLDLIDVGLIG